jgi:hypothetical protein
VAKLQYWRADNMWAAEGRPDGNLGMEEVDVPKGTTRVFVTDWQYEKQRNDGVNFYGSHARKLTHAGGHNLVITLTSGSITLFEGQSATCKGDIKSVRALTFRTSA